LKAGYQMPMPSTGIIVLLFFCGAGVLFMLWTLYHFVLESTRRKTYGHSERPVEAREREQEPNKVGSEGAHFVQSGRSRSQA
jgi:hypothetical protein